MSINKNSKVYFFVDGPKKSDDKEKVKEVIKILNNFKKKHNKTVINISNKNLGTYLNLTNGISNILKKHKNYSFRR